MRKTLYADAGLLGSMGTVGDAIDNAVAESFFASSIRAELFWPARSFDWIEVCYNRQRCHRRQGYLSPIGSGAQSRHTDLVAGA